MLLPRAGELPGGGFWGIGWSCCGVLFPTGVRVGFLPACVPILTLGVAESLAGLDSLSASALQGPVVAGMGAGTIPPHACKRLFKLAQGGLPVVLCSGALGGRTAEDYYYPQAYEELRAAGIFLEDRLTPRKARIRLLISLGLKIPYLPFGQERAR